MKLISSQPKQVCNLFRKRGVPVYTVEDAYEQASKLYWIAYLLTAHSELSSTCPWKHSIRKMGWGSFFRLERLRISGEESLRGP